MSESGHSLPIHSASAPNNVRYASNSDRILRRSEMALSAIRTHAPQKLHHQAGRSLQRPTAGHGRPQLVSVGGERRYFDPLLSLS